MPHKTPKSSEAVLGSEARKRREQEAVHEPPLLQLGLLRPKLILFLAPIVFVLTFLPPPRVCSQAAARILSGKVTNESGSRIPNVHLSIINKDNGSAVSATGKKDGSYKVSNLAPGNYEVTASAEGFESASVS